MKRTTWIRTVAGAGLTALVVSMAPGQTVPMVWVGHPGNPANGSGFGAVGYEYRIGQSEVTNAQYAAFLNAVAATDIFGLYNSAMSGTHGGIVRSGESGSYLYATIAGRERCGR